MAAYGDGLNHHEGDALAPDDAPELYTRNKAMSERALFRLHQRMGLPVVTLRPPYVYGPDNPFYPRMFVGLSKELVLFYAGSVCGRDRRDEISRIRGSLCSKI